MVSARPLLLLAVVATSIPASVLGKNFNIRSTAELEAALALVSSGDKLTFQAGTFVLKKPMRLANLHTVTVQGRAQGDSVLDGSSSMRVLELLNVQNVIIKQLKLQNGHADATCDMGPSGGAMVIRDSSDVSLTKMTIQTSSAEEYGGGMVVINSPRVSLTASSVTGNRAAAVGGGIAVDRCPGIVITGNTMQGNVAGTGAAVAMIGGGGGTVDGNTISGNQALDQGGGLAISQTQGLTVGMANVFSANLITHSPSSSMPSPSLYVAHGRYSVQDSQGNVLDTQCTAPPKLAGDALGASADDSIGPFAVSVARITVSGIPASAGSEIDVAIRAPGGSEGYSALLSSPADESGDPAPDPSPAPAAAASAADYGVSADAIAPGTWTSEDPVALRLSPTAPDAVVEVYEGEGDLLGRAFVTFEGTAGEVTAPIVGVAAPRGAIGQVTLTWSAKATAFEKQDDADSDAGVDEDGVMMLRRERGQGLLASRTIASRGRGGSSGEGSTSLRAAFLAGASVGVALACAAGLAMVAAGVLQRPRKDAAGPSPTSSHQEHGLQSTSLPMA